MKRFMFIAAAAGLVFLFGTALQAQHQHRAAGSISSGWDTPCVSHPSSTSDYPWGKQGNCGGATACEAGHASGHQRSCVIHKDCNGSCGGDTECRSRPAKYGASWCGSCNHQHCTPAHMYSKNCDMIDALQATYCVSTHYLLSLRQRNNASYGAACSSGQGACLSCAPSREYTRRGTLESLNGELAGLRERCNTAR